MELIVFRGGSDTRSRMSSTGTLSEVQLTSGLATTMQPPEQP